MHFILLFLHVINQGSEDLSIVVRKPLIPDYLYRSYIKNVLMFLQVIWTLNCESEERVALQFSHRVCLWIERDISSLNFIVLIAAQILKEDDKYFASDA